MKRIAILVLALVGICLGPVRAQESALTETSDDPGLPGWERTANVGVREGALRIEPDGYASHGGGWSELALSLRARRTGGDFLSIRYAAGDAGSYLFGFGDEQLGLVREAEGASVELAERTQPTRRTSGSGRLLPW
jgi:hypothetical protein